MRPLWMIKENLTQLLWTLRSRNPVSELPGEKARAMKELGIKQKIPE